MTDDGQTPRRKVARSRRTRSRGWEWLPSKSIRCRVRGKWPDGLPIDEKQVIPWQGSEQATEIEADRCVLVLRKLVLDKETGAVPRAEATTLAAWVERARRSRWLPAWRPADQSAWKSLLRPLWNLDLRELHRPRLDLWLRDLVRGGRSANYVRGGWGLLRRIVGLAVDRHVIPQLPWGASPPDALPPEDAQSARRALSTDEAESVMRAAAAIDEAAGGGDLVLRIETLWQTGARPIEVCMLTPADVMIAGAAATLRMRVMKQKRGRVRIVTRAIPHALAVALQDNFFALPDRARALGVVFPVRGQRARWTSRWTERVRRGAVERESELFMESEIRALRVGSGVEDFTGYQLRHTSITALADQGLTTQQLMARTGHTTDRMLRRYVKTEQLTLPDFAAAPVSVSGSQRAEVARQEGTLPRGRENPSSSLADSSSQVPGVGARVVSILRGRGVGESTLLAPTAVPPDVVERAALARQVLEGVQPLGATDDERASVLVAQRGAFAAREGADELVLIAALPGVLVAGEAFRAERFAKALQRAADRIDPPTPLGEGPKKARPGRQKVSHSGAVGAGVGNRFTVIRGAEREDEESDQKTDRNE